MLDRNQHLYFSQIGKLINLSFCDDQYLVEEGAVVKSPTWQFCTSSTVTIRSSSSSSRYISSSSSSSSSSSTSCYTGPDDPRLSTKICDPEGSLTSADSTCFCFGEVGCDCPRVFDTTACCCCQCCYEPDNDPCSPTYGCCVYTGCSDPDRTCYPNCNT